MCCVAVRLQYFQEATTFMEQAKASHDQAVAKLTKSHKDATTHINRSAAAAAPYHPLKAAASAIVTAQQGTYTHSPCLHQTLAAGKGMH